MDPLDHAADFGRALPPHPSPRPWGPWGGGRHSPPRAPPPPPGDPPPVLVAFPPPPKAPKGGGGPRPPPLSLNCVRAPRLALIQRGGGGMRGVDEPEMKLV